MEKKYSELDGKKVFWKDCLNCMGLTTEDFQKKLPLNCFFRNCCYIQLQKKNDNVLESITSITQDITKALLQVLVNVFPKGASPEKVCDSFKSGWRLYQTKSKKSTAVAPLPLYQDESKHHTWEMVLIVGLETISENNAVSRFDIEKPVHRIRNGHDSSDTINKYIPFLLS